MSVTAGWGTARMTTSPSIVPVWPWLMWVTVAPPSVRTEPMAPPMFPVPMIVKFAM